MKKVVLTFTLFIGFGVYGFATNKIEIKLEQGQKQKNAKNEKTEKYDFSLFKFIRTQAIKNPEADSIRRNEETKVLIDSDDDTTSHYVKPLDFFRFS